MTDFAPRILEFSTDGVPEQDRMATWREHFGHVMLRVDLEPEPGTIFESRNRCLALPGLQAQLLALPVLVDLKRQAGLDATQHADQAVWDVIALGDVPSASGYPWQR